MSRLDFLVSIITGFGGGMIADAFFGKHPDIYMAALTSTLLYTVWSVLLLRKEVFKI